jgi:hypothetical protein
MTGKMMGNVFPNTGGSYGMKRSLGMALALGVIAAAPLWADTSWGPEEQVTNSSKSAHNGAEAVDPAGTLHMLTVDDRTGIPCIFYQHKPDGASAWSSQTVLSHDANVAIQAGACALGTDRGQGVYAVWEETYNGGTSLYFRRSTDDGLTWGDAVLVAEPEGTTTNACFPSVAVDKNGTLHLTWLVALKGQEKGRLMYRKGSADGLTLSTPLRLESFSEAVSGPKLAAGGNQLLLYFQETDSDSGSDYEQIKYLPSQDFGDHWSSAVPLTDVAQHAQCRQPSLVFDTQDNFYCVWSQESGSVKSVAYRYSDHVSGLAQDVQLPTAGGTVINPVVATRSGLVVVAWGLNNTGNWRLQMASSSDQGATWTAASGTTQGDGVDTPCLVNDRDNFHLFYSFDAGDDPDHPFQVRHLLRDDTAPPAPVIHSATHPTADASGNNRPSFTWTGPDNAGGIGVAGYALLLDAQAATDPGNTQTCTAAQTALNYGEIPNGAHYLHLRTIDLLGNLGAPAHYALDVDNRGFLPADQAWVAPSPIRTGRAQLHYFLTEAADVKVEFFDGTGRKLGGQTLPGEVGVNLVSLTLSDWVNGTYFFRVTGRALAHGQEAAVTKPFMVVR